MIIKQMLVCLVLISTNSMFAMQRTGALSAGRFLKSYTVNCTPLSSMHRANMNNEILRNIKNAKESIFVNMYSFTSTEIACALALAKDVNKAKIKVILDRTSTGGTYNMKRFLGQLGIDVRVYSSMDSMNHNKYVIIDEKKVILGSYNYSKAAAEQNLESAVVLEGRPIASFYKKDFEHTESQIKKQEDQARRKNAKIAYKWWQEKRKHQEYVQQFKKYKKRFSR